MLLGQMQSDPLEHRFGSYRRMAGSNYFISVRQIIEAEKCIRLKSLLKFSDLHLDNIKEIYEPTKRSQEDMMDKISSKILSLCQDKIECFQSTTDDNLIYYLAGYACRSVSKVLKCEACVKLIVGE